MNQNKKENKFILYLLSLTLIFPYIFLVKGITKVDWSENRNTQQFIVPSIKNILNKTFQDGMENFISDQFAFRNNIKKAYFLSREVYTKPITNYLLEKNNCKNNYVLINKNHGYYQYNCEDYYVVKKGFADDVFENIKAKSKNYNEFSLNNVNIYYYLVNNSATTDFNSKNNNEIYNLIKENFIGTDIGQLKINDFEEFKKYFNKTDHHWNHKGAYQAYIDITNMIVPNEKKLEIKEEVCFEKFNKTYGSIAKQLSNFKISESLCTYNYGLNNNEIILNDEKNSYNFSDQYYYETLKEEFGQNHYGNLYGGDYPKLIIKGNNDSKRKLLLISNSYGNAVRQLLANHFNELHEIDLRHFSNYYGEKFYIEEYIKNNEITDVLYLGDVTFYILDLFNNNYKE